MSHPAPITIFFAGAFAGLLVGLLAEGIANRHQADFLPDAKRYEGIQISADKGWGWTVSRAEVDAHGRWIGSTSYGPVSRWSQVK